jgi:protein NRD1
MPDSMQYVHGAQNLPSFQAAATNMQQHGVPQFPGGMPPNLPQGFPSQGIPLHQQQHMLLQNMQNMQSMQGMQGLPGMQGMGGMTMPMGAPGWPQIQQGVEG